MNAYKGKIRLVIKNYPYKYRDYAHIAAEASLAARDQNKYWEMHDMLIKRSPRLRRKDLIGYASELGLDTARFSESISRKMHAAEIERDKELGARLRVFTTPTFFINGRKVIGERPFGYFRKIIEEELSAAR